MTKEMEECRTVLAAFDDPLTKVGTRLSHSVPSSLDCTPALTKRRWRHPDLMCVFASPGSQIFAFYASLTLAKLEKLEPKTAQLSPLHMGYAECVAFGRVYGVIALGMLTTTEFSTLYIDSLAKAPTTEYDRVLTYDGFCELLVRLSRKVVPATVESDALPSDKRLKGLFQLMWLACASNSPRALKITDVLKTDRVDVLQVFLVHFEKFWKKEQYE